jgi:sugar lactone lactonase YvrE
MRITILLAALAGMAAGSATAAGSLSLVPHASVKTGLANPESALWSAACGCFYVSNVAGGATDADGNGYLSKVGADGTLIDPQWVTGLDAPKGLAERDGRLWVSDINVLVEIDAASGRVLARHRAEGAKFLNDVAAGPDGSVYVTDMLGDAIWRLRDGRFEAWATGPALEHPNGLYAERDRLLLATWGVIDGEGFATSVPGRLKSVDYATATVTDISPLPVGNLDGIEPDGHGGYLVTDWVAGRVLRMAPGHGHELLLESGKGTADLGVHPGEGVVALPMMLDNRLDLFRIRPGADAAPGN